ncbi:ornithine cyclodeaminase [Octadecabacter sp. 1_MG-2023]|uniref:ornithine cyclodeaminase family protein n=1 Tax=unclassified Octadecabacter TaxID=196158 RepID=UPI001C089B80|nr:MULTISPECIES: ornithine cyclodeaminase [unclassified Octadecabacter]MBU2992511.1 ornithine cyclodeaminase [Octadecabacter sp. B2R22]MDO6734732.1 ornithine cyclodeaminase [Octadecabacter sp. 1_MG-2023]
MTVMIPFEDGQKHLDWIGLTDALAVGHLRPKATVEDVFLYRDPDTLLNRSAWIDGMGLAIKCATIFPDNRKTDTPMIHGAVNLFSDSDGQLEAILDFHLVTKWKTAGDSLLAARRLARPDSKNILIVGAGTVGRSLWQAYGAAFPDARFKIWNRSLEGAKQFAHDCEGVDVANDLEAAVREADIITSATMTTEPIIKGDWLQAGQHVDLIGAYRPDMREVDDVALQKSRIFVDSYETTMGHIGELKIPLEAGTIAPEQVIADYYEPERFLRGADDDITLFKNGGGAHLDLMTSRYILDVWKGRAA